MFDPPCGAGIRNDVGVEAGGKVGLAYDSMLAKLIVYAADRERAVDRLIWALRRYPVLGLTTNVTFLLAVAEHPEFRAGRTFVDFVPSQFGPKPAPAGDLPVAALLAAAGFDLLDRSGGTHRDPWQAGPWRITGASTELSYRWNGEERTLRTTRLGGGHWQIALGTESVEVAFTRARAGQMLLRHDEQTDVAWVAETDQGLEVFFAGQRYLLTRRRPPNLDETTEATLGDHQQLSLSAPMPSVVVKLHVAEGDQVRPLQTVVILEAMKMEHTIQAPHGGIVRRIRYHEGELVPGGATLLEIEET